jgi:muconolactone delta-isomerase
MRFLVMTSQGAVQPPPEALPFILPAFKDWMHDRVNAGKVEAVFSYVEGGGGCGIVNVTSHEELNELLISSPMGPFSNYEVRALADFDQGIDNGIRAFEAMAAAASTH